MGGEGNETMTVDKLLIRIELTMATYQNTLRHIRLCKYDGAERMQHFDKNGVVFCRREGSANVTQGSIVPLDVELILEGHDHPVQWPKGLFFDSEEVIKLGGLNQSILECYFRQTFHGSGISEIMS